MKLKLKDKRRLAGDTSRAKAAAIQPRSAARPQSLYQRACAPVAPRAKPQKSRLFSGSARGALLAALAMFASMPGFADAIDPPPQRLSDPRELRIQELEKRLVALEAALLGARPPASAQPAVADAADAGIEAEPVSVASESAATGKPSGDVIDALAAERALERTLVRGGALLLPVWQVEIEPSLAYVTHESAAPILVANASGGVDVASGTLRRQEANARLSGRMGLPADFQLEASIGFDAAKEQERALVGGSPIGQTTRDGSAVSDISVGLARTLYKSESSAWDLVGRVGYNSGTGNRNDGDLRFANGFEEVSASLTALTRQDPLVFVAGATYTTAFERGGIDPGDLVSLNGATILAVSPETSIRFGAAMTIGDEFSFNGEAIKGTDPFTASLQLGFSTVLSRGRLFDIGIEVGLTEDSPAFAIAGAMPLRMPGLFR